MAKPRDVKVSDRLRTKIMAIDVKHSRISIDCCLA